MGQNQSSANTRTNPPEEEILVEEAEEQRAFFVRCLDRLCWWRQGRRRRRLRGRKRRRSGGSSCDDRDAASSDSPRTPLRRQPAKVIRIDAATEVERRQTVDTSSQTMVDRERKKEEGKREKANGSSTKPELSWLNYPFLTDRRSLQFLQSSQVMMIMRGLPGSGKSTVVRAVQATFPQAVVCSADNYFELSGSYHFDPAQLKDAHNFSQQQCEAACQSGVNLVVVDNTNVKRWEMTHYFRLAEQYRYAVILVEPRTPWRSDAKELARLNSHGVSLDVIRRRLAEYEVINPRYLGWFLNPADSRQLVTFCSDWLLKLLNMSQEFYNDFCEITGWEDVRKILSYYTRNNCSGPSRDILHCTAKFFRKGDSTEFMRNKAVVSSLGESTRLEVVGLTFTPRTLGARIRLSASQLELWYQDDDELPRASVATARPGPNRKHLNQSGGGGGGGDGCFLPRSNSFSYCLSSLSLADPREREEVLALVERRGRRAHFTIGLSGDVAPVQTGLDQLEVLRQLEQQEESCNEKLVGGQLSGLGQGRWYFSLAQPVQVNALFTGCY